MDYIRQMNDDELKLFFVMLNSSVPEYEWCGGICPHAVESGCDIDAETEVCPYSDAEIVQVWLESELIYRVKEECTDIILQISKKEE